MNLQERHTVSHVEEWRREGFTLIPEFFSTEEILPIIEDFQELYEDRGQGEGVGTPLNKKEEGAIGAGHPKQFMNIDSLPYNASSAINLISLHPALISFAKSLLDVDDVHLYQSHTWAKYTGEADYDQAFHCDFGNHTLTVPADDVSLRTVDFILYLTDITDAHGALHYVTKTDSDRILGSGAVFAKDDQQFALKEKERSAAAPAGSLLAHSIDTFHRGTNLTEIDGHRFTMTVGYKASGNEMIGFHVWQSAADRPWPIVLNNATPEQLQCLGIPLPGDVFWTDRTLKLTQLRWPEWDMSAYVK
tara:strand:+ start:31 stop:942 length:912 start_codon:yes stop_codon:yes gene_type:complete